EVDEVLDEVRFLRSGRVLVLAEALRDDRARIAREDLRERRVDVVVVVGRGDGENDLRARRHRVRVLDVERGLALPVGERAGTGRARAVHVDDGQRGRSREVEDFVEVREV